MSWYGGWRPYIPVAKRRAKATNYAQALAKKQKRTLAPVEIAGRKIASTFWGEAWCENLERYSDFANRLPRGRTYVRNGSVIDLQIAPGKIEALVSGSDVYKVAITIDKLAKAAWGRIRQDCTQSIDSMIDLLQARFGKPVMERLTEKNGGLFPQPKEIRMSCSCPDWAGLCKHVAAVLYGVGARLDASPELLFTLRDVDHLELISQAVSAENLDHTLGGEQAGGLAGSDLGELFGIDLDPGAAPPQKTGRRKKGIEPAASSGVADPVPNAPAKPKARLALKSRKVVPGKKVTAKKRIDRPEPVVTAPRQRTSKAAIVKRKAR